MKPFSVLKASPTPVRARLFRDMLALLAVTLGLIIGANLVLMKDIRRDIANARIDTAKALVRDEVRALLTPVQQQLLIIRDRLRSTDAAPPRSREQAQGLDAELMPALSHIPQIAGIVFADDEGAEYFLYRDSHGWVTRLRAPGATGAFEFIHRDTPGEQGERDSAQLDYDPRQRPWFVAARQQLVEDTEPAQDFIWSPPYRFETLDEPGITVSSAWRADAHVRVLALDLTLARILDTIARLPTDAGTGFLFDGMGGLYTEAKDTADDGRHFYSAEARHGGPLRFNAIAAWRAAGRPDRQLVRFVSNGQDWWGGFLPLTEHKDGAWIGVVIPVSATLAMLQSRWHLLALTAFGIVVMAIGLAALLVRKYRHQLRELPKRAIDAADPEADIRRLIARGENTHIEFKSTMRMNLHTNRPGKEIELAWLKGVSAFLNCEGGVLLIGVADDGEIRGIEADGFASDDKCRLHFKNLIDSHLGPEYGRFLRLELYRIEEKTIAAVECEPADTPVFLRHRGTEIFLIRNGPSTMELPISKALGYIPARF